MRLLTCKEVSAVVSQGLDRKLSVGERFALKMHLALCKGCRNFVKQTTFIRRAIKHLAESSASSQQTTSE